MRFSKTPVTFANRAEMMTADYSTCAHVPEQLVKVNLYHGAETSVVDMSPDEARELAHHLIQSADTLAARPA
jgi:hypothetical protein